MKNLVFAAAIVTMALTTAQVSAQANTETATATAQSAIVVNWSKCEVSCRRGVMSNACPTNEGSTFLSDKQVSGFKTQADMFEAVRAGCNKQATLSPAVQTKKFKATGVRPGEYAKNSTVYAAYSAACGRASSQGSKYESISAQRLEDEAAKAAEDLHKNNLAQYNAQIETCMKILPTTADRKAEQKVAQNVSPAVAAGAGVAVGFVAAKVLQNGRRHHGGRLSTRDFENLEGISQKALGPVPNDAVDYTAHVTRTTAAPARGCVNVREFMPGKGTFNRWRCPKGTVNRLGW